MEVALAPHLVDPGGSYYRARYYDPSNGRFLSEDPAGFDAGVNFYTYVDDDPTNYEDPQGLQKYKCPLFGPCRRLTKHEQKRALSPCCKGRTDFYNMSFSYGAPWGPTVSVSVDRGWNTYVGAGVQYGKSPFLLGGNLTVNRLDSACVPTAKQLDDYLSGANVSVTGAFGLAFQQGVSPTNAGQATGYASGVGIGSPQAGVSGTYSGSLGSVLNFLNFLSNLVP